MIYPYGASRNKKIQSEISTNSCMVQGKKKFASTISSLSNLNIRIACNDQNRMKQMNVQCISDLKSDEGCDRRQKTCVNKTLLTKSPNK